MTLLGLLAGFGNAVAQSQVIVSEDTEWRFRKGLSEASTPDTTAWRQRDFNDASWSIGRGPFYYEDAAGYSGNTALTDMRGAYSCVFLRKSFNIVEAAAVRELTVHVQADDGALVWINGTVVGRVNMPEGEPVYNGTSLPASGEPNVETFVVSEAASVLRNGANVLAVQAFNADLGGSSDFMISVSLTANLDAQSPVVESVVPPVDARVRALTSVEVIFSENVTGVEAGDLLVNGVPATSLNVISPRDYAFGFAEPAVGTVTFSFAASAGITDLATPGNPMAAAPWTCILDPNAPPADLIISEFLADNANGKRDDLGNRSDWIELFNRGDLAADLDGWFLTDDRTELTKWRFPAVTLERRSFLLVWASGEDRVSPLAALHTNFKLSPGGEYLALVDPKTNIISEFAPVYPAQRADVSFGRDSTSPDWVGFYATPTPGAANGSSGPGFAPEAAFSVSGGVFTNAPLSVAISAPSGTIRFTTDGTRPSTNSAIYTAPINVARSMVIQARVFQDGLLPSPIGVQTYTILGVSLTDFSSNLPLLVISTAGRGIAAESRTAAFVSAIEPVRGRASLRTPPTFVGNCQVELRGQSSLGFPKVAYNLELNDANGNDLDAPLLGLPAESDWVLYNPYSDKPFLQNFLAYELHAQMGHYAPRCRFVELFLEKGATAQERLVYPGDYQGIYLLVEKIKVAGNRVDLERLTPEQNAEPEISGGYMFKKDKDSPGDRNFVTQGGGGFSAQSLKIHEPKPREVTTAQINWLRNYLVQFEKAMYAPTWLSATGTNHYAHYIDVDSFVDNHWMVEFAKQIDGYRLSNYMSKDRGGKVRMDPIWDWNLSFGNADYLDGANTAGWYYTQLDENAHIWLRRLMCGTTAGNGTSGDPDFNQRIADRWSVLRTNILNSTNLLARIDEMAGYLNEAQARDFARWPRLGTYIWPNPPIYSTPTTYAGIIANLKNWVRGRYTWIDGQFVKPPQFSRLDSGVSPGFALSMTAPAGSVYYTTDGTDPRLPGGGVSTKARVFSSDVILESNARVVARARSGSKWSGPTAATFTVAVPPLVLTELMYSPAPTPGVATNDAARFEYLELMNAGTAPLDLRRFRFTGGIQFDFFSGAVTSLEPGARLVLARDPAALAARHGSIARLTGPYAGSLANEGEKVTLLGPMQEVVLEFTYDPRWFPITDGLGFALVPAAEGQPRAAFDHAAGWRTGSPGGTPGQVEPAQPALPSVVINEIFTHTDPPLTASIELFNNGPAEADLGGWYLSDDRTSLKYRIPAGTRLAAGAYRVFTEADFNPTPGLAPSFSLRASGDDVFLFSADAEGRLTGYLHGFEFGAALNGVAFGRLVTSTGEEHLVAQSSRSLAQPNPGPQVGPVVISEIMYHPPDVLANGALWDNTEHEFIELQNISSVTVPLFDPNASSNTWRLRDAVQFAFPVNQLLNPADRVLVVSFDPAGDPVMAANFRSRYGLGPEVRLFGPYEGKLANGADSVELIQPDLVRFYATNEVITSVLVDRVNYRDAAPWPAGADGAGFSLQRKTESDYGDDPVNWVAAAPTPGSGLAAGTEPTILTSSQDQVVLPGTTVTFQVEAAGPGPLRYQWRHDGANLVGATGQSLVLTNVQPAHAGIYEVVVSNPSRATDSAAAVLQVLTPPTILRSPESKEMPFGAAVSFAVIAAGSTPLSYQWRHNGVVLAGANAPTFAIASAGTEATGSYDVVVSDELGGTSTSAAATLTVQLDPTLDTDQDGMPDVFENEHGLDPRNAADAAGDSDQDGASNLDEYFAGTDPQSSASVLKIAQLEVVGGVTVRFLCLENRSYTLQYREMIEGAPWHAVTNIAVIPGAGPVTRAVEVRDPGGSGLGERFYRLVTPATP